MAIEVAKVELKTVQDASGLEGLIAVNVDKESRYRSTVNVLSRPAAQGIELVGHHEILLPLLHAAVACGLASNQKPLSVVTAAA